ncbi:hypothetical protein [Duganella sp. P38]|uniref:hypothetical protein n=1 Tax=Duganella sp. P38 TaxID=3423949 RepID=UPI003D78DB21
MCTIAGIFDLDHQPGVGLVHWRMPLGDLGDGQHPVSNNGTTIGVVSNRNDPSAALCSLLASAA